MCALCLFPSLSLSLSFSHFIHSASLRFGGLPSLGFERLTLVPIETKMVETAILSPEEIAWLDQYHRDVS